MFEKKLLNFQDVVEIYSIKPLGLRWLIRTRQIPFVRLGTGRGRIYYDPVDLDSWIKKSKIPASEK
ncbi:helix-turn-helix domain-containing protein [Desulfobacterota bacterium AH_259_B03_O07]|nr:helix-turn-helix domain-containing protein [Desulfobacterota bacterium AH_259_B03_O07]